MPRMEIWPKRLYSLDIARGVASIGVVVSHWQHFSYVGSQSVNDLPKKEQPFYTFLRLFYEQGGRGVDFFFLLSGFVFFWLYHESIKNKIVGPKEFFVARFSRLYPLHLFTLLLVAVLQSIFWVKAHHFFVYPYNDVYHFILNLFFASYWGFQHGWSFNAPVWSVSIEVLLYLVFFIVSLKRLGNIYFSVIVSVISFMAFHVLHHPVLAGLCAFFLGGTIFHLINLFLLKSNFTRNFIHTVCIVSWLLVLLHFYVCNLYQYVYELGWLGKLALAAFPIFILFSSTVCSLALLEIRAFEKQQKLKALKSLSWIGDISYSSYMLHFPLQAFFGLGIVFGFLDRNFYLKNGWFLFFFLILIPLSYLSFSKFERRIQARIRTAFS